MTALLRLEKLGEDNTGANLFDVTSLIEKGKKGITNKQMIPALRNALDDENYSIKKLDVLYKNYEEVFISASKYVPDRMKLRLERFIQGKLNDLSFQLPMGKKLRYKLEEGEDIEEKQIKIQELKKETLVMSESFKSKNNEKLALIIKDNDNWKEKLNEEEVKMVELAIQDLSTTEIGDKFKYSKDKVYTLLFRNNGKSVINKLEA